MPFFVSLNLYKAAVGDKLPSPKTWLEQHWAARMDRYPELPPLDALLREGRLVLLLDALNEMPHQRIEHIEAWRDFLARLVEERPGNRVIFSCRMLDYGAKLSTKSLPVPQVRIEQLTDQQVEEFIEKYASRQAGTLWEELRRHPRQLDLYRSPYYLKLLVDQAGPEGKIPLGRAARHVLLRQRVAAAFPGSRWRNSPSRSGTAGNGFGRDSSPTGMGVAPRLDWPITSKQGC